MREEELSVRFGSDWREKTSGSSSPLYFSPRFPQHSQGSQGCWSSSRLSWCEGGGYTQAERALCGARETNNSSQSQRWTISSHPKRSRTDAGRTCETCAQKGLGRSPGGTVRTTVPPTVSARCKTHNKFFCSFFFFWQILACLFRLFCDRL